jgi:hypothetical protein
MTPCGWVYIKRKHYYQSPSSCTNRIYGKACVRPMRENIVLYMFIWDFIYIYIRYDINDISISDTVFEWNIEPMPAARCKEVRVKKHQLLHVQYKQSKNSNIIIYNNLLRYVKNVSQTDPKTYLNLSRNFRTSTLHVSNEETCTSPNKIPWNANKCHFQSIKSLLDHSRIQFVEVLC